MKQIFFTLLCPLLILEIALGIGCLFLIEKGQLTLPIIMAIYGAAQLFICLLFVLFYKHRIFSPARRLQLAIQDLIENRDLTAKVSESGTKGMADLIQEFNQLTSHLDDSLITIGSSIARLEPMSRELADTNMGLSQRNIIQRTHNQNIAQTLKGVESTAEGMALAVAQIMDVSKSSNDQIKTSLASVNQSYKSIHRLATETESATNITTKLHESSREIGEVVTMINTIAEQTNLLALNAAIEAARAGEAGRGFSVVADEVRNLSIKTQESTLKIEDMIKVIQIDVDNVMQTMQQSRQVSETSVENIDQVKKHFDVLYQQINDVTEKSTTIENAIGLQQESISQVVDENNEMNEINADIVRFTKNSAISENDLINLGNYMSQNLHQFTLSQTEYDTSMRTKKNDEDESSEVVEHKSDNQEGDEEEEIELF